MFFKGILIGLLFGVPVGAVGAMTVQRTWEHGTKAGLTAVVALARKKKRADSFQKMNRIFGMVLSLFGILVFIQAIPI